MPRWFWLPLIFVPLVAWSKDAAVVAVVASALVLLNDKDIRAAFARPPRVGVLGLCGAAFLLWAAAAIAWSPTHHATDWFKATGAIMASVALGRCYARMPAAWVAQLAGWFIGATVALFVLLFVERITGGFFIGLVRAGDQEARLFDLMSPGLGLLSCLAFPTAHLLRAKTGRWLGALAFLVATALLALSYRMDAAWAALASGGIAYLIARLGGWRGFVVVIVGIAAIALAWGPAASLAWQHGAADWFTAHANYNWGYRVEIWHRVYGLIGTRLWIGHGFDTARVLGHVEKPDVVFLHPHNGMLQVWLELGLIGVILLLVWIGAAVRGLLATHPRPAALAIAAATVTALSVFWLISFGIWQGWWISAIGFAFCSLVLVRRADDGGAS